MLVYAAITACCGSVYSNLVVTYPPDQCPEEIVAIALRGMTLHRLRYASYSAMRDGEVCTALPFSVARVASKRPLQSLILLAHDAFIPSGPDDLLFETPQIILVTRHSGVELPTDGLSYLLNELEPCRVDPNSLRVIPFICGDTKPANQILDQLRAQDSAIVQSWRDVAIKASRIDKRLYLPFVNLAALHFKGDVVRVYGLQGDRELKGPFWAERRISRLWGNPRLDTTVNLGDVVQLLRKSPVQIPKFVGQGKNNLTLIRSIAVSEWLVRSSKEEDRTLGGTLAARYGLPLRTWREAANVNVWGSEWEKAGWMGVRAIAVLRQRRNDRDARQTIAIIERRRILLAIFPILFVLTSWVWIRVGHAFVRNEYATLASAAMALIGPLILVGVTLRLARLSLSRWLTWASAASFLGVGLLTASGFRPGIDPFHLLVALPSTLWLLWSVLPLPSRIGKPVFAAALGIVPATAMSIEPSLWIRYFQSVELAALRVMHLISRAMSGP